MLLWTDVETTGLVFSRMRLLEVAVIATDDDFREVARAVWVTSEAREFDSRDWQYIDKVVRDMHAANGLWGESIATGRQLKFVATELEAFIRSFAITSDSATGKEVLPQIAGNTVSFDRRVLETCLPQLDWAKLLHYRHLDVSSVNELARRTWPQVWDRRPRTAGSTHRAMADVDESLAVARYYREALGPVGGGQP